MKLKKSTLITAIFAFMIAVGACFYIYHQQNASTVAPTSAELTEYNKIISQGKAAARKMQYAKAQALFEQAYAKHPTKAAKIYAKQAKYLQLAIKQARKSQFSTGIKTTQTVINEKGYWLLNDHAKRLIATLKTAKSNYQNEIKPLLAQATTAESQGQVDTARENYQKVLDLSYIKQPYYQKYFQQAEAGIARLKDQTNSTTSKQSSSRDTGTAGSTGAGAMGDHTVNGKTVTQPTLDEIRAQLTKLGYNASAWSPQDLIDLFRHASENGHTKPEQITKEDVDSF